MGAKVKTIHLKESLDWHLDLDELESMVNDKTKLISICNPSNPTGAVMTDEEMESIAAIAEKHGAYIHQMRYIEDQSLMEMKQKVLFTFMINRLSHVVYQNHSRTLD